MEKLTYDTLHNVTDGVGNGSICPLQRVDTVREVPTVMGWTLLLEEESEAEMERRTR